MTVVCDGHDNFDGISGSEECDCLSFTVTVFATVIIVVLEMTVVTVMSEKACTNEINSDDCDCSDGCDGCRRSSFYDCDEFFCLGRMR